MKKILISLFAGLLLAGSSTQAAVVQWSGNGHYYEIINKQINWYDAKTEAENMTYLGLQGHLATITSAEENQFLTNTFLSAINNKWLGGFQPPGTGEPNEEWSWVTGEVWNYTNWNTGEPNDVGGEDALSFWSTTNSDGKTWNDAPFTHNYGSTAGYVVEYQGVAPIPEPSSLVLGLLGLGGAIAGRRRKNAGHK